MTTINVKTITDASPVNKIKFFRTQVKYHLLACFCYMLCIYAENTIKNDTPKYTIQEQLPLVWVFL